MKDGQEHMRREGGVAGNLLRSLLLASLPGMGGPGEGMSGIEKTPKDQHHIFTDAKLVGAQSEVEYLQNAVVALLDAKTELTEKLKAAEERRESDDQVIENLREANREQKNRISDISKSHTRQQTLIDEMGGKLRKSRKAAQDRQTVINKIMAALGNVPEKKPIKADYLECFAKIQEIVTAPPETPAPEQAQTQP